MDKLTAICNNLVKLRRLAVCCSGLNDQTEEGIACILAMARLSLSLSLD